jgi:hypothetical protein
MLIHPNKTAHPNVHPTFKGKSLMPQLDKVTFLSQFVWLCFFFFSFYLTLVKHFLPKMSRLLKLRQRKMNASQEGSLLTVQETDTLHQTSDNLILNGIKVSRSYFSTAYQSTSDWVSSVVETTNQTAFKPLNEAYIASLRKSQDDHGFLWLDLNTLLAPGSRTYLQNGVPPLSGLKQEALFTSLMIKGLQKSKLSSKGTSLKSPTRSTKKKA